MPTGVPIVSALVEHAAESIDYLQIPPYQTYKQALQIVASDFCTTAKSSWHLLVLTLTPFYIILKLLTHLFLVGLGVIAEHTIKHGVVTARECALQVHTGLSWFVAWQRSLSIAAVAVELATVAAGIGLYMIRRYIQKHRYVERTQRWFRRKLNATIKLYNGFVRTVSKTSVLLALLLPHLLYVLVVVTLYYVAPWFLRYFAMHTPTTSIISVVIPLVRTISFLNRWKSSAGKDSEKKIGETDKIGAVASPNGATTTAKKRKTRSSTGRAADRYLEATMKPAGMAASTAKKQLESMSADQTLRAEGMDLLRYWVVYALLCALFRAISLMPVVGSLVTAGAVMTPEKTSRWAAPSKPGRFSTLIYSLRPNERLIKEIKLVFFIWLLYLPTSLTGAAAEGSRKKGKSVKDKVTAWETKIVSGDLNRPVIIVYKRFAPIAVSVAKVSLQLTQEGRGQQSGTPSAPTATQRRTAPSMLARLLTKAIGFIRYVLEVTVFTRMISPETRDWILAAIADGAALLPAAITLAMPGYFTQFGVLYVSNVVPAASSSVASDSEDSASMARYLRYWVIHTLLSCLLESFRPVLAWVPLSTHATWILWAYLQFEPVTTKLFALIEWDLTAFGLLHAGKGPKNGESSAAHDMGKAVTIQLLKKASSILPKAKNTQQEASSGNTGEKERREWEMVQGGDATTHVGDQLYHAKVD